jgi:hypothetical protein
MSYSTLYTLFKTTYRATKEYRNSWGTGPLIWSYLNERYLHRDRWAWTAANDGRLWGLAREETVPLCIRMAHVVTFDRALIPIDKAKYVGNLLIEASDILKKYSPDYVNHFASIGNDLIKERPDKRAIGFGLNCTSVSDVWHEHYRSNMPFGESFNCVDYIDKASSPHPSQDKSDQLIAP